MVMRRYFLMTLGGAGAAALAIASFLYWLDPFAVLHASREEYYPVDEYIRIAKPHWAAGPWNTVVIGSSVSLRGMPPSIIEATYPDAGNAFNFGIYSVTTREMWRYTDHVLAVAPVRRLLIEARPFLLGGTGTQRQFSEGRMAVTTDGQARPSWRYADLHLALFSADAVEQAIKILFAERPDRIHRADGEAEYPRSGGRRSMINNANRTAHRQITTSPEHLKHLRRILEAACAKDVSVDVYFPPMHALYLERLYSKGVKRLEVAKSDVARVVFSTERKCQNDVRFSLWDFMVYSTVTTERIPADEEGRMTNFDDLPHFTRHVGAKVAAAMASGVADPRELGTRLSPGTMKRHLRQQRRARITWYKARPEDKALYDRIGSRPVAAKEAPTRKK